jgi:hypothetical protein
LSNRVGFPLGGKTQERACDSDSSRLPLRKRMSVGLALSLENIFA